MNIVIINTAFDNANYIVIKDDKIHSIVTDASAKHSETSLVNVDKLLKEATLSIKDVDVFCVNLGPGSFTGIRIGVAMVKGFLCAFPEKKLVLFNSFEPYAFANINTQYFCLKASKDDYYVAKSENGRIIDKFILENDNVEKLNKALIINENFNVEELINFIKTKIDNKEFSSVTDANPLYLKLSQAEKELLEKEKNNVDSIC